MGRTKGKERNGGGNAPKRKRGGQHGNQNAKGNRGNPHPNPPPIRTIHGAYSIAAMDTIDSEERELIAGMPMDEEHLLMEEIQLLSIRERRILKTINRYRQQMGGTVFSGMARSEEKRSFKDDAECCEYEKRQQERADWGEKLPGEPYSLRTHTENTDFFLARLERELSSVQDRMTKAIEVLSEIRMERQKMENEAAGSGAVDDWIAAVMGNP